MRVEVPARTADELRWLETGRIGGQRRSAVEGTCRYLVADRMDITGARWSVDGAEAVLKLPAVRSNGDFDEYWTFHLDHERQRVHESRYADSVILIAA